MKGFTYKSYSFIDKDPIIDQVRTVVQDSGQTYQWIEDKSGVTSQTLRNWFAGRTKRPQFATVNAVLRSLGMKLIVQNINTPEVIRSTPPPGPENIRQIISMSHVKRRR